MVRYTLPIYLTVLLSLANSKESLACQVRHHRGWDLAQCKSERQDSSHINKDSIAQSDLRRLLAGRAWIKARTKDYPHRVVIQLKDDSKIQVYTTEFDTDTNRPFFKFDILVKKGKSSIVPMDATLRAYVLTEMPYRLEQHRDSLIIEAGTLVTWEQGIKREINLKGEYTSWLPTNIAMPKNKK